MGVYLLYLVMPHCVSDDLCYASDDQGAQRPGRKKPWQSWVFIFWPQRVDASSREGKPRFLLSAKYIYVMFLKAMWVGEEEMRTSNDQITH